MKNSITLLLLFFLSCFSIKHAFAVENNHKKRVLLSVAPYSEIVRSIAGDNIIIDVLVPQGVNFHTYEPTPRAISEAAQSAIWFCIGEPFEKKASLVLQERNVEMRIVDLRKNLSLIMEEGCHHKDHHEESDPHIWLSAKMMQIQAETICDALIAAFPAEEKQFVAGKNKLVQQLQQLDEDIEHVLEEERGGLLFVSHPAYGYFCRDYGLSQMSIEQEGKEPGPRYITSFIKQAKEHQMKAIFVQPQHSDKAAKLIAKLLHVDVVVLDPCSDQYFEMMHHIAFAFHEAL